jgi:hypothetical protein
MKKVIVLVACVLCAAVFAQNKPQIAIYVAGEELKSAEKKAIETKMSNAFVESGRFIKAERNNVFLSKITTEIEKQKDGSVDDEQIISSGNQAGAQFVCVVDVINAFGTILFSARVLDVKAATAVGMGEVEIEKMDNASINDAVGNVFKKVISQMDVKPAAEDTTFIDPRDKRKYKIKKIGEHKWFLTNLSYNKKEKYTWNEAYYACPEGWRLPNNSEWNLLKAKATDQNYIDFCQAVGGVHLYDEKGGENKFFWSATGYSSQNAYIWRVRYQFGYTMEANNKEKTATNWVRCVQD